MECDLQAIKISLNVINGKWKTPILWLLTKKKYRFNELLRAIPNITRKVMVEHLKQLENDNIVLRTVFEVVPPRVEYSLTEYGETLIPIFQLLNEWGQNHTTSSDEIK